MLTRAHQWSLSGARWNQSTQVYHMSLRSILILSPRIGLSFLSGLFTSGFPTKILCALLIRVSRSQIVQVAVFDLKHISTHITGFSLVLFMIHFLLLHGVAYIYLNSLESYLASTFLFITLMMYRTRTHRYLCPSQESGILSHVRVWTAPIWCCQCSFTSEWFPSERSTALNRAWRQVTYAVDAMSLEIPSVSNQCAEYFNEITILHAFK
jgi:hypothetical protein